MITVPFNNCNTTKTIHNKTLTVGYCSVSLREQRQDHKLCYTPSMVPTDSTLH